MPAHLSIIIPTVNERDNVEPLLAKLDAALAGIAWEAVFVDDDSTDGTVELLERLARESDRVRFVHRVGRRGLSSACIEGMLATAAPYIAVMDADMQHDETVLPRMLAILEADETNLVIGSRYMEGGGTGAWSSKRVLVSRLATRLARALLRTEVSDPMSGFFMLHRDLVGRTVRLMSGEGFKILLDLIASAGGQARIREVPYTFRPRRAGETKLDTLVAWEYLLLLYDKLLGHLIPVRFLMFVSVGGFGAVLHLAVLGVILKVAGGPFHLGQSVAAVVAMVLNFSLNNVFTYRDRRLRGGAFLKGLAGFLLICAVGAFVNIQVAVALFSYGVPWWGAGLVGAGIGAVWNFAIASTMVWHRRRCAD